MLCCKSVHLYFVCEKFQSSWESELFWKHL